MAGVIDGWHKALQSSMTVQRPVVLLILDGWGIGEDDAHNAIYLANTPHIDTLLATYPNGPIGAAGEHIRLKPGHQGSTEMGHLIISAGRNVLLPQMQVQQAIQSDAIGNNPAYSEAIQLAKQRGTRLHLMGLLSDAGVHSYDAACYGLIRAAAQAGLQRNQVYIHIFSDGRDTPPTALPTYVERLQTVMDDAGVGLIADLQGRYWAMDRDHRWERVEAAYTLLTSGVGKRSATSIEEAIAAARDANETDEFIAPTSIDAHGCFRADDVVINFNYRVDREIEITQALIESAFDAFPRPHHPHVHYVATFPYYSGMPAPHAFEREELKMKNILPEVLSTHGLTQYRLTETEKWVYLTKIFNAMREEAFPGETRHLISSDKVATYDERPAMKAVEIAENCVEQLRAHAFDTYFINICNADILGHTGNKEATIIGCEAIDKAIGIITKEIQKQNGILLITADHGDAERMWDHEHNLPHTQHTDSFVPFILVDAERKNVHIRETGALRDVAPTILELLGIPKPEEMTGESLLV
jgi:2,3-bisphosphoglycerate-independent phosphoglycerate mutase